MHGLAVIALLLGVFLAEQAATFLDNRGEKIELDRT
jgi:hypothetical protein